MSSQTAARNESFELQNETTRLMIRATAIVFSVTAVLGIFSLPMMPMPAGIAALSATVIAVVVAWWQTTRPRPDAFGLLLVWETLTAISGSFAESPIANAQTMSLFAAVFLGVFLLDGRRMWTVLAYAWVVWGWMMVRIAPGVDGETLAQIGANHAITLVIGTSLMLTLRRRMRYVIDRAVERFHALPVGALRMTTGGEILDANERLVSILGCDSVEHLMSRNAEEFFVERGVLADIAAQAAADGSVQGAHILLRTKRGADIEGRATVTTTRDSSGSIVLEATIEDISALTSATRRADQAEERFAEAFESAPIGMLMVSTEGRVLKVNNAVGVLFESQGEELGARVQNWLDEDAPQRACLISTEGAQEGEYPIARSDGTEAWVRARSTMLEDDEGPFFVVQLVDVTSQRMLEDSLRAIVQAKDEFIASVSHELRTPLTAVVGFSDMLVNDNSLATDERAAMQRLVHGQAVSVSHIVEDLLVAARVENGQLSVNPRTIDLGGIVHRAIADCEHAVGARATPQVDGQARAWADPERVQQIIRNLVTNAARYGGEQVSVVISNSGETAQIAVVDDGNGIEPNVAETIWEPYARAHPASLTTTDSIGLGLAVSRQLSALMDGELSYRYEDGNSVFELTLPATRPSPATV